MKKLLILAFVLTAACSSAPPVAISDRPVSINDRPVGNASIPSGALREMKWSTSEGELQRVKDHTGKVLILDFWATYCPPCIEEIPHLMELRKRYAGDVVVIGLNVGGEEDRPKIPAFVEKLKIDYPIGYPEDAFIDQVFAINSSIPQTMVIGRGGEMVDKIVGFDPEIGKQLDASVERAVKGK